MVLSVTVGGGEGAPVAINNPSTNTGPDVFKVINPYAVSPDVFSNVLTGDLQEMVLKTLIQADRLDIINNLRPDMRASERLTYDELRMADWYRQIMQRDTPIRVPTSELDDGVFSQIQHTVLAYNREAEDPQQDYQRQRIELAKALEVDRLRNSEFAPFLFAPSQKIGKFEPSRIYLAILSQYIARTNMDNSDKEEFTVYPAPVNTAVGV